MSAIDDPLRHLDKMRACLSDTAAHLRHDMDKVHDPLFQNMFGQAADVLDRLVLAFDTYENGHRREPS